MKLLDEYKSIIYAVFMSKSSQLDIDEGESLSKYLSPKAVAEYYDVSVDTVKGWAKIGIIRTYYLPVVRAAGAKREYQTVRYLRSEAMGLASKMPWTQKKVEVGVS